MDGGEVFLTFFVPSQKTSFSLKEAFVIEQNLKLKDRLFYPCQSRDGESITYFGRLGVALLHYFLQPLHPFKE